MPDRQQTAVALRLSVGRLARRLRQESLGDLTPSQRSALATLDREGPLRMTDLAAIERVSPPSMTGIVGRLEERRLVTRHANPHDARSTVVSITQRALDLLAAIRAKRTAFLTTRLSTLADDEILTLTQAIDLLKRITEDA
jgi:DNA-binding MarR family transcriptional regulator